MREGLAFGEVAICRKGVLAREGEKGFGVIEREQTGFVEKSGEITREKKQRRKAN